MSADSLPAAGASHAPHLQIYGVVRDSYRFVFLQGLRLSWEPTLLGALLVGVAILQATMGSQLHPVYWLLFLAKFLILALFLPPLQRRILGVPGSARSAARTILTYGALMLAFDVVSAPWNILFGKDHGSVLYLLLLRVSAHFPDTLVLVMIGGVIYFLVTFYIVTRLAPAMAMAAIGKIDFRSAWNLTRNNFWRITGACILSVLPILAGTAVLSLSVALLINPRLMGEMQETMGGHVAGATVIPPMQWLIMGVVFLLSCWVGGITVQLMTALDTYIYKDRVAAATGSSDSSGEAPGGTSPAA